MLHRFAPPAPGTRLCEDECGSGRKGPTDGSDRAPLAAQLRRRGRGPRAARNHDRADLDAIVAALDRYAVAGVPRPAVRGRRAYRVSRAGWTASWSRRSRARCSSRGAGCTTRASRTSRISTRTGGRSTARTVAGARFGQPSLAHRLLVPAAGSRYSMLSAKTVPAAGGETEYADMRAAYDARPTRSRHGSTDCARFHSIMYSRQRRSASPTSATRTRAVPGRGTSAGARAPRLRPHGPCTWPRHAERIVGWPVPDGRILLRELIVLATQPAFV